MAGADLPLLDLAVLRSLAEDIGEDGVTEVAALFLAEAPRIVERVQAAISNGGRALLREVHTLASAARNVGLLRLGAAAADMEMLLGVMEPGPQQVRDLLTLLELSVTQLEACQRKAELAG